MYPNSDVVKFFSVFYLISKGLALQIDRIFYHYIFWKGMEKKLEYQSISYTDAYHSKS